jgi:hypothetical protein
VWPKATPQQEQTKQQQIRDICPALLDNSLFFALTASKVI